MKVSFGPAGSAKPGGLQASGALFQTLSQMGLDAFEYPCALGVTLDKEEAESLGAQARGYGIKLSLHAPFFINLSSDETERIEHNLMYILKSCAAAGAMGAGRIVLHCGGLGKLSRRRAMEHTKNNLKLALGEMDKQGYGDITLSIETMGQIKILGTASEVMELVRIDDRLSPCIDFGHLNARTHGKCQTEEEISALFALMENRIGLERARCFHSHFSKIQYGPCGELRHLTFADQVFGPCFEPIARQVLKRGWEPRFICESAGTQLEDAKAMKEIYEKLRG